MKPIPEFRHRIWEVDLLGPNLLLVAGRSSPSEPPKSGTLLTMSLRKSKTLNACTHCFLENKNKNSRRKKRIGFYKGKAKEGIHKTYKWTELSVFAPRLRVTSYVWLHKSCRNSSKALAANFKQLKRWEQVHTKLYEKKPKKKTSTYRQEEGQPLLFSRHLHQFA